MLIGGAEWDRIPDLHVANSAEFTFVQLILSSNRPLRCSCLRSFGEGCYNFRRCVLARSALTLALCLKRLTHLIILTNVSGLAARQSSERQ